MCPDTCHLRAGVCLRIQQHAGGEGSWGPSLGNLEAIVTLATFIKHIPCACTPLFNPTATPWVGMTISNVQMDKLRFKGIE